MSDTDNCELNDDFLSDFSHDTSPFRFIVLAFFIHDEYPSNIGASSFRCVNSFWHFRVMGEWDIRGVQNNLDSQFQKKLAELVCHYDISPSAFWVRSLELVIE